MIKHCMINHYTWVKNSGWSLLKIWTFMETFYFGKYIRLGTQYSSEFANNS